MNAVPEEVQTYADLLEAVAIDNLPDEKPSVRKPLLNDQTDVLSVKLVVRGGRNVIDWSVPLDAFNDDDRIVALLEDAIATAGLAGIVRVVRANPVPVTAEPGGNVISPNPATPPAAVPPPAKDFYDELTPPAAVPPPAKDFYDELTPPGGDGDDPDAFVPEPPKPAAVVPMSKTTGRSRRK